MHTHRLLHVAITVTAVGSVIFCAGMFRLTAGVIAPGQSGCMIDSDCDAGADARCVSSYPDCQGAIPSLNMQGVCSYPTFRELCNDGDSMTYNDRCNGSHDCVGTRCDPPKELTTINTQFGPLTQCECPQDTYGDNCERRTCAEGARWYNGDCVCFDSAKTYSEMGCVCAGDTDPDGNGICNDHECTSSEQCGDNDACTNDACDNYRCVHAPACGSQSCAVGSDGQPLCSDQPACTPTNCSGVVHECHVQQCEGPFTCNAYPDFSKCDDGLFCTLDWCDPEPSGCSHPPRDCSDGKPWTWDRCLEDSDTCEHCGITGCSNDADNDGTPDDQDGCPQDMSKTVPGICGCGNSDTADYDGDGTVDCMDGCPQLSSKQAPGLCGCGYPSDDDLDGNGIPDCFELPCATDTDGDGASDCIDGCAGDPNKTVPGVCGCSQSDQDTDGDLTPNCQDACPSDRLKVAPGACGCGIQDDSNGDGVDDCGILITPPTTGGSGGATSGSTGGGTGTTGGNVNGTAGGEGGETGSETGGATSGNGSTGFTNTGGTGTTGGNASGTTGGTGGQAGTTTGGTTSGNGGTGYTGAAGGNASGGASTGGGPADGVGKRPDDGGSTSGTPVNGNNGSSGGQSGITGGSTGGQPVLVTINPAGGGATVVEIDTPGEERQPSSKPSAATDAVSPDWQAPDLVAEEMPAEEDGAIVPSFFAFPAFPVVQPAAAPVEAPQKIDILSPGVPVAADGSLPAVTTASDAEAVHTAAPLASDSPVTEIAVVPPLPEDGGDVVAPATQEQDDVVASEDTETSKLPYRSLSRASSAEETERTADVAMGPTAPVCQEDPCDAGKTCVAFSDIDFDCVQMKGSAPAQTTVTTDRHFRIILRQNQQEMLHRCDGLVAAWDKLGADCRETFSFPYVQMVPRATQSALPHWMRWVGSVIGMSDWTEISK